MLRKILILCLFFFALFVFWGCASKPHVVKTELDQLFESNFEGLEVPKVAEIKEEGLSRIFPYVTFDEVWDSAIIVLMQQGIIVRSLWNSRVIVTVTTPPLVIFVDRGETITVYLKWMDNFYKGLEKQEVVAIKFSSYDKWKMAKAFFDKLATQVYAGEKWKYLYKESSR